MFAWSAQSCVPHRQSWRRLALGTPVQPGVVLLCRRDRRHGKPGGMLHWGQRLEVERAVLRATPDVRVERAVLRATPAALCRWLACELIPARTVVQPF